MGQIGGFHDGDNAKWEEKNNHALSKRKQLLPGLDLVARKRACKALAGARTHTPTNPHAVFVNTRRGFVSLNTKTHRTIHTTYARVTQGTRSQPWMITYVR